MEACIRARLEGPVLYRAFGVISLLLLYIKVFMVSLPRLPEQRSSCS